MGVYKYIRGLGEVWVDSVPPPSDTTNPLWLKLPESIEEGFQLLIWIDMGTNAGKWMPVVGTKGDRGPSAIVVQNEEPENPEILIWVDPDETPGTVLEIKTTLGNDNSNPISQKAVTDALNEMKIYIDEQVQQKSLYQIWLDAGNSGTIEDFLESLKGTNGNNGLSSYELAKINGFNGTLEEWLLSIQN